MSFAYEVFKVAPNLVIFTVGAGLSVFSIDDWRKEKCTQNATPIRSVEDLTNSIGTIVAISGRAIASHPRALPFSSEYVSQRPLAAFGQTTISASRAITTYRPGFNLPNQPRVPDTRDTRYVDNSRVIEHDCGTLHVKLEGHVDRSDLVLIDNPSMSHLKGESSGAISLSRNDAGNRRLAVSSQAHNTADSLLRENEWDTMKASWSYISQNGPITVVGSLTSSHIIQPIIISPFSSKDELERYLRNGKLVKSVVGIAFMGIAAYNWGYLNSPLSLAKNLVSYLRG